MIALAVIAGIAVFIVIPILIYLLCRKWRRAGNLSSCQIDLSELDQKEQVPHRSEVKRLNSLPCRLKKSRIVSSNGTGSVGESGVYDMTDHNSTSSNEYV